MVVVVVWCGVVPAATTAAATRPLQAQACLLLDGEGAAASGRNWLRSGQPHFGSPSPRPPCLEASLRDTATVAWTPALQ